VSGPGGGQRCGCAASHAGVQLTSVASRESARVGARERQQDKAQGTQRMQLLAVVIQGVGASQPMAEED
jgi:hypothetical protein